MVRKILGFLYGESGSLNQAAFLLGSFAFLSQILAFLRDRLLAHIFGAGAQLDIYYAAFRIPDLIFVTAASLVSLSVLVPFIIERETRGREDLKDFLNTIFSFFMILILSISLLAYFIMPSLNSALFRGLNSQALENVTSLSRLLLLSPILLGFSNLLGSVTQAYNRFTLYALAPLLYNTGIIFGIIFLTDQLGIQGVALGVVAGAFLHMAVQAPFVLKERLWPKFSLRLDSAVISRVIRISLPRTLTLSMSAIVLVLLVSFASLLSPGSISVLSFSINLQSVPLSIIGVSYSLAAFPTLSRRFQENNLKAFIEQMQTSSRFIIFWSLPITALLIVERAQIVRVLLGTGLFDWGATRLTAAALALFVVSSVFQSLLLLFMRGFYSAGFTKKPFLINLISTALTAVSAYLLIRLFQWSDNFRSWIALILKVENVEGAAVLMLPLAFSLGTIFNCVLLWFAFEKEFTGFSRGVSRTFFQSLCASLVMGLVAYLGLNFLAPFFDTGTLVGLFLQGLLSGVLATISGIAVLIFFKSTELGEVLDALRDRFWKTEVIATDPEIV